MLERGAHGVRVRVVGVVHDETSSRERALLTAPGRETDTGDALVRTVERETERVVDVERGERVHGEMALRERKLELDRRVTDREPRRTADDLDLVWVEASERDVVAYEVRLEHVRARRDDRGAARRKRRDRLGVRLRDPLDGSEELEVLRPDVRDDGDRRTSDRAERRDLTEPAHAHLRDENLRLRLEPTDGQRKSDLVVEAPLRPDRRHVRRAQRADDVLRRRLPRRADDRDDLRVALLADERSERGQRHLLVVRDERRRASRPCLADELRRRCSARRRDRRDRPSASRPGCR